MPIPDIASLIRATPPPIVMNSAIHCRIHLTKIAMRRLFGMALVEQNSGREKKRSARTVVLILPREV